jgi:hypothetical protein
MLSIRPFRAPESGAVKKAMARRSTCWRGVTVRAGLRLSRSNRRSDIDVGRSGTIGKKLKKAADELSRRLGHTAPLNEQPPEVETIPVKA